MTVATMTLRAARQRNVILAVIGASMLVSLLLLSQTHSRLRRAEEDVGKCQQEHDSVSAQLTVLYEHKARLEKTLQAEIDRKKAVDDELKTIQAALSKEKAVQSEKLAKLQRQVEELKTNENQEFNKLKATYESLRNDKEKLDAEVEELNVQAQRLREHNHKLEEEVRKMQQSEPIDMNEVVRLRDRVRQCDADQAGLHVQAASDNHAADGRVLQPPGGASSRRPNVSTRSRRIQNHFAVPSADGNGQESLMSAALLKAPYSNEGGGQGAQASTGLAPSKAPEPSTARSTNLTKTSTENVIDPNLIDDSERVARIQVNDTAETSRPHEAVPGQVPVPESTAGGGTSARAVAEKSVDVLGQVPEENKADMAVLPVPQGSKSRASSSPKPANAGEIVDAGDAPAPVADDNRNKGILHVPLDSMQQVENQGEGKSILGHHFGPNVDRNQLPIFRQNANKAADGEDRDYPDNNNNNNNNKDDDAGADDGDEGGAVDNKNNENLQQQVNEDNEAAGNPALEDMNNNNDNNNMVANGNEADNGNAKVNPDFDDPNVNLNELEAPRGVKVLPK